MTRSLTTPARFRIAAAAGAALAVVLAAGPAAARIPGVDDTGTVVVTDSTLVTVEVGPDTPQGRVSGALRNTAGFAMECYTPGIGGVKQPNQVTDARIVASAVQYYSRNIFVTGGLEAPVVGALPVGSLYDFLPTGSYNGVLGPSTSGMLDLKDAQDLARIKGHTGAPYTGTNSANTSITVGAGARVTWTADLGLPSTEQRSEFQAGALFFCTGNGTSYVFAGYEGGTAPTEAPERPLRGL